MSNEDRLKKEAKGEANKIAKKVADSQNKKGKDADLKKIQDKTRHKGGKK
jgi:hypothetical protein